MTQITGAMISKARDKAEELVLKRFNYPGEPGSFHHDVQDMATRIVVAALAVAPDPAPDDAEFEQALADWQKMIDRADRAWSKANQDSDEIKQALKLERKAYDAVLALHRQAKHAGLRELRDDLAEYGALNDHPTQWDEGFVAFQELALDKIDDLLTEATDDR
jgi:hypothetical protein